MPVNCKLSVLESSGSARCSGRRIGGALCALVIYGGIINPASAIMWQPELNVQTILAYYVSGFPMDAVLAVATAVFLWVFGEAMLEKLDRIKVKYGLVE